MKPTYYSYYTCAPQWPPMSSHSHLRSCSSQNDRNRANLMNLGFDRYYRQNQNQAMILPAAFAAAPVPVVAVAVALDLDLLAFFLSFPQKR
mmetsp:Transcript_24034/g.42577  ORF Transcript_24034/g.42577 Transcript_24034/m.42577 type:complete len:91 (+) Transcript_24034:194-466(+)